MKVLGMISGTSHDGIDCVIARFDLSDGVLNANIEYRNSFEYSPDLRNHLKSSLPPSAVELSVVTALDTRIGQEFAAAAEQAIAATGPIDVICTHGQTVFHWVENGAVHGTLQLGQPAWIAERNGVPVISDVRARDIAVGGQGAPLAPVLDRLLLSGLPGVRAALNLGGIANATVLAADDELVAYDIGPANALIDAAVGMTRAHPRGYDQDGMIAAAGQVHPALLEQLLTEPYYAARAPKSTGKELFNEAYIAHFLERSGADPSAEDLVATLTELTVRTVAEDLRQRNVATVIASGGGADNVTLMEGLRREMPQTRITTSEDVGVASEAKEAFAFALIGWLSWHGVPSAVPSATGAHRPRILGSITPGSGALQLPMPLTAAPTTLRINDISQSVQPSGTVSVRDAGPDDAEAIAELFYQCWTISYSQVLPQRLIRTMDRQRARQLWTRSLADTSAQTRVIADAENIVGVIGFAMENEHHGHIRSLYVSPHAQGGGYGRRLIETAIAELTANGAKQITLWVFEENLPSRKFYERMGWISDGQRSIDPSFGEPQIRMTRELS